MTRTITALSDRLLALVAPRAVAKAACKDVCSQVACYCQGARYYEKTCCYRNCKYSCGTCRYIATGC